MSEQDGVNGMNLTEREHALVLGWIYTLQKQDWYKFGEEENALIEKLTGANVGNNQWLFGKVKVSGIVGYSLDLKYVEHIPKGSKFRHVSAGTDRMLGRYMMTRGVDLFFDFTLDQVEVIR
ncbi:hypothetical protein [Paenibacillus chitinolyticus]|uniref:hypothetical protein n=1 Tax=Paenibacillus chitinolyticus TaxID=79263 RepID=UPI00295E7C3A|nr:hypothetical protein [Paenibacillus chitinolyticus]